MVLQVWPIPWPKSRAWSFKHTVQLGALVEHEAVLIALPICKPNIGVLQHDLLQAEQVYTMQPGQLVCRTEAYLGAVVHQTQRTQVVGLLKSVLLGQPALFNC